MSNNIKRRKSSSLLKESSIESITGIYLMKNINAPPASKSIDLSDQNMDASSTLTTIDLSDLIMDASSTSTTIELSDNTIFSNIKKRKKNRAQQLLENEEQWAASENSVNNLWIEAKNFVNKITTRHCINLTKLQRDMLQPLLLARVFRAPTTSRLQPEWLCLKNNRPFCGESLPRQCINPLLYPFVEVAGTVEVNFGSTIILPLTDYQSMLTMEPIEVVLHHNETVATKAKLDHNMRFGTHSVNASNNFEWHKFFKINLKFIDLIKLVENVASRITEHLCGGNLLRRLPYFCHECLYALCVKFCFFLSNIDEIYRNYVKLHNEFLTKLANGTSPPQVKTEMNSVIKYYLRFQADNIDHTNYNYCGLHDLLYAKIKRRLDLKKERIYKLAILNEFQPFGSRNRLNEILSFFEFLTPKGKIGRTKSKECESNLDQLRDDKLEHDIDLIGLRIATTHSDINKEHLDDYKKFLKTILKSDKSKIQEGWKEVNPIKNCYIEQIDRETNLQDGELEQRFIQEGCVDWQLPAL